MQRGGHIRGRNRATHLWRTGADFDMSEVSDRELVSLIHWSQKMSIDCAEDERFNREASCDAERVLELCQKVANIFELREGL